MTDQDVPQPPAGKFVLFAAADGKARIECRFAGDTLWLSQAMMAELYQVTPQAITQHVRGYMTRVSWISMHPVKITYRFKPKANDRSNAVSCKNRYLPRNKHDAACP